MVPTALGIGLGVAGLVAAYVFYRKGIRQPRLEYLVKRLEVVPELRNSDFKLTYRDKPISQASALNLVLRNGGNAVLDSSDIARRDPVRFRVAAPVLAYTVGASTSTVDASIEKGRHGWMHVNFDYLDPQSTVHINVLHGGDVNVDVAVCGSVKGAGPIEDFVTAMSARVAMRRSVFALALLVFPLSLIITGIVDDEVTSRAALATFVSFVPSYGVMMHTAWRFNRGRSPYFGHVIDDGPTYFPSELRQDSDRDHPEGVKS